MFEKESFWSGKEKKRRRKKTWKILYEVDKENGEDKYLNIEYLEKKEIWFETSEEDQLQLFWLFG